MVTSTPKVLFELAERHGGFFATYEALELGINYRQLSHYAETGLLERPLRGAYRLTTYPAHKHSDKIVATLWAGAGSVVSHESALSVYDLAAAMPPLLHITVPHPFRGIREGVRVHIGVLRPDEQRVWDDVPVTAVERTLIDVARSSDPALVRQAVGESLDRGLTTRRRLSVALAGLPAGRAQVRRTWALRLPPAISAS
jgi:predicted transcriptional regulator of viral defense system